MKLPILRTLIGFVALEIVKLSCELPVKFLPAKGLFIVTVYPEIEQVAVVEN